MSCMNLSNPKPGYTTGGSGQIARRNGLAGSGKIECQKINSPRNKIPPSPPRHRKNVVLTSPHQHKQEFQSGCEQLLDQEWNLCLERADKTWDPMSLLQPPADATSRSMACFSLHPEFSN